MRAVILIREQMQARRETYARGLAANGLQVVGHVRDPQPGDVVVVWNRHSVHARDADRFEAAGATVLVAENGYMGKAFAGAIWNALSIGQHNGVGLWRVGGPERWDSLGVDLAPWRDPGGETVVLPQRGIGAPGVAMPRTWPAHKYGRVRPHPGTRPSIALEDDLAAASAVVTWGSGAALKALALGVPVYHAMPKWIGAPAALPVDQIGKAVLRDDAKRLAMFRRLAWAMWTSTEIESGEAFKWLMSSSGVSSRDQVAP